MNHALLTAAAGMKAQMETLDLLANNIANAATTGYKADNEFHRLFQSSQAQAGALGGDPGRMPVVEGSMINFQQGALILTEAPLDVALSGPGFLVVEAPAGRLYTRNGHLTRSAQARLRTSAGYDILDAQDRPIDIPLNGKIEIGADGMLSVGGLGIAQIAVVEFPGRPRISKAGSSYFKAADDGEARPALETTLRQGRLEASNVSAPISAVRLMLAARNFQMLREAASLIGQEIDRRAVDELGSIGR